MPSESTKTVLVTGASGFVGLNVVEHLLTIGQTVVALSVDEFPAEASGEFADLPGQLQIVRADVTDAAAVAELSADANAVIHGAAVTASDEGGSAAAGRMIEVNIDGTRAVLEAARRHERISRVVYVSSGAVYGASTFGIDALSEDTRPRPSSLYGLTKLASELLVSQHAVLHGTETVSARISAVFGPWEHDSGVRDSLSPMYQLARAAQLDRPVIVGEFQPRNWLYARDAAVALVRLAIGRPPLHGLYNISPDVWTTPRAWAERLAAEYPTWGKHRLNAEKGGTLTYDSSPERPRAAVDNRRIRGEVPNWPSHDPDRAFDDYLGWLRRHGP